MINIAEIIDDPDFVQAYDLYRHGGYWLAGKRVEGEQLIKRNGVIVAANSKDLLQVPEGDRVKGIVAVYDTEPLLVTNKAGTSDQIVWRDERYRLFQVWPYADYGYYKALGERMAGD